MSLDRILLCVIISLCAAQVAVLVDLGRKLEPIVAAVEKLGKARPLLPWRFGKEP